MQVPKAPVFVHPARFPTRGKFDVNGTLRSRLLLERKKKNRKKKQKKNRKHGATKEGKNDRDIKGKIRKLVGVMLIE